MQAAQVVGQGHGCQKVEKNRALVLSADRRGSYSCIQTFVRVKKAQLFGPGVEPWDAQIDIALSAAFPPPWEPPWHFSSSTESCWTSLNIALRALPTPPALLEAEPIAAKHPALRGAVLGGSWQCFSSPQWDTTVSSPAASCLFPLPQSVQGAFSSAAKANDAGHERLYLFCSVLLAQAPSLCILGFVWWFPSHT